MENEQRSHDAIALHIASGVSLITCKRWLAERPKILNHAVGLRLAEACLALDMRDRVPSWIMPFVVATERKAGKP